MNAFVLICIVAGLLVIGLVLRFLLFEFYNSPDGERYRKIKMQGPFVPLSKEDIAEDEERAHRSKE